MTEHPQPTYAAFRSCGVRIDAVPLDEAARQIASGEVHGAVHLCNAYTLALATRDEHLDAVLEQGVLNLPDGMPLVWISRRLGIDSLPRRVYGPDLMELTLDVGRERGTKHYLFGSTDAVLEQLTAEIERRWPGAAVVGSESPPFSDDESVFDASVERIDASGADVVWVGLGTPKQDLVVQRLAERSDKAFVAIGAAFDFLAGTKKQAPNWVQDRGLEWAYRLVTEPRRLWKRYLVGNSLFVYQNVRHRPRLEKTISGD